MGRPSLLQTLYLITILSTPRPWATEAKSCFHSHAHTNQLRPMGSPHMPVPTQLGHLLHFDVIERTSV